MENCSDLYSNATSNLTDCGGTFAGTNNALPLVFKIPVGIIMIIMMFISLSGNIIVCIIVYQKPAMRSAINLLLANMALSNILLSVLCMPFAFITMILDQWIFGDILCRIVAMLHLLLVSEAMAILLAISLDRYLIIVRRRDKLNPLRARLIIGCSWCFSFAISIPPLIGWATYEFYDGFLQCVIEKHRHAGDLLYIILTTFTIFFLPMTVMSYSYLCILNTVRKNSMRVQNQPDNFNIPQVNKLGLASTNRQGKLNVDMSFKTRAFKTILILYLVFLICWAPYAITSIVWNLTQSLPINYIGSAIVLWLGYMNSGLNPMIYCWRIKKFREACQELLPKSVKLLPQIPRKTQRRVNPSSVYEFGTEHSSSV